LSEKFNPSQPVLIVDDEPIILESMETLLAMDGMNNTILCSRSTEVMDILEINDVGLILLDLMMPGISGTDLLQMINDKYPLLPVIIITGYDEVDTAVNCMKMNAYDYLVKPLEGSRVVTTVKRAFDYLDLSKEVNLLRRLQREIADRKKKESDLKMLEYILSFTADHLCYVDPDYRILSINDSCLRAMGISREMAIGRTIEGIIGKEVFELKLKKYLDKSLCGENVNFERWINYPAAGEKYMMVSIHPYQDETEKINGIVINSRDITERVKLEKSMVDAGENERRRIGMELHDGLSSSLLNIAIKSKLLSDKLESVFSDHSLEIVEIKDMINASIGETRNIARGLYPAGITEFGLYSMIEEMVMSLEQSQGIKVELDLDRSLEIADVSVRTQLYYIIQESVKNSVKHSGTDIMSIKLKQDRESVILIISDNGCGISDENANGDGIGINIMRYRSRMIGAVLDIHAKEDGGTEVVCTLAV